MDHTEKCESVLPVGNGSLPANSRQSRKLPFEYARGYLNACISVIPISKNKQPIPGLHWREFSARMPSEKEISDWWQNHPQRGIGAVCGAGSGGLQCVDVDDPDIVQPLLDLIEDHSPGMIARLAIVRTPRGGAHLWLRCSVVAGNQKLAMRRNETGGRDTIIETRAEGGYALLPGSPGNCHPTGGLYDWTQGEASTIPFLTPEDRELILVH